MLAQRDTSLIGFWAALTALTGLALCACARTNDGPGIANAGSDGGDPTELDGGATDGAVDADRPTDEASSTRDDEACESLERHDYQTCVLDPWSDAQGGAIEDYVYEMELTGTVEAIEDDVRCTGVGSGGRGGVGYGVRIAGDGEGLTLGFTLPFTQALFEVGETLHVKYERGPEPFASEGFPPAGSVEIRDTEGQLLYWIAETYDGFDDLDIPPELTITDGWSPCTYAGSYCNNATRTGVYVEAGTGLIHVPYGKQREVGELVILHGDNERHDSPDGMPCLAHHRISIAAVRGAFAGLGTPGFGTSF